MTHITDFKTKKSFKEALDEGQDPFVFDPSIINPVSGPVSSVLSRKGSFTITNHPRRSWCAEVSLDELGEIAVY